MEPKKFKSKHGPEHKIQAKFIKYLEMRGWRVERMIGNQLQMGIPDIYCMHPVHGTRWVDLKHAGKYEFTKAQIVKWPLWRDHGVGIWIIVGWSDEEYNKLFAPPNWEDYWKPKYNDYNVDIIMQELFDDYAN